MKKRGQTIFGMSFGVIFSIILIIIFISVAFYAIRNFLGWNQCAQIGLFYTDLEKEVNKAWNDEIYIDTIQFTLPSGKKGIKQVCFGNLTQSAVAKYISTQTSLKTAYYFPESNNVFLLPVENACDIDMASFKLNHVSIEEFFCGDITDGKISITLSIRETQDKVTLLAS